MSGTEFSYPVARPIRTTSASTRRQSSSLHCRRQVRSCGLATQCLALRLCVSCPGHKMEAVPSAPRTRASERRAENRYYQELQVEAKEEKAKNALRHEDKAEQKQKHQLSAQDGTDWLSDGAQDAKDDMNKWYDTLDSKVKKTARVVKAEKVCCSARVALSLADSS
eukprot:2362192-Rhodomonas_salina.1